MAHTAALKPAHKALKKYYEDLKAYSEQHVEHEGALETAFSRLLADTAKPHGWMLIPKQSVKVKKGNIIPDGTLRDLFNLQRGFWEAKDTHDDLDEEIRKKIAKGYPLNNTIFEDTRVAVLYQNGREINRFNLHDPQKLADLLNDFYAWTEPNIEGFEQAVQEFKERVPELALAAKIKQAHQDNPEFEKAFEGFFTLCQQTLNPNISRAAVDEMLVQHLLTERLFRTIFKDSDFTRRNGYTSCLYPEGVVFHSPGSRFAHPGGARPSFTLTPTGLYNAEAQTCRSLLHRFTCTSCSQPKTVRRFSKIVLCENEPIPIWSALAAISNHHR
jgi:hypothetical protein